MQTPTPSLLALYGLLDSWSTQALMPLFRTCGVFRGDGVGAPSTSSSPEEAMQGHAAVFYF